jgi:hypothetical protein
MPLYWIRYDARDEHKLWRRLLPFNDHIGVVGKTRDRAPHDPPPDAGTVQH